VGSLASALVLASMGNFRGKGHILLVGGTVLVVKTAVQITDLTVEIVSVVRNVGPDADMILARGVGAAVSLH